MKKLLFIALGFSICLAFGAVIFTLLSAVGFMFGFLCSIFPWYYITIGVLMGAWIFFLLIKDKI